MRWYLAPYRQYASFSGRAGRAEYWTFGLINFAVSIILRVLADVSTTFEVIDIAFALLIIVPSIAVTVRRLHDTDRSGWFALFLLVPVLGWALVLSWTLQPSDKPNQHGAKPGQSDTSPVDDRAVARSRAEELADWQE